MASTILPSREETDIVERKISDALREIEKQVHILCDRERSAQEKMASEFRRLAESQRQIATMHSHTLELDTIIDKERKRHREEVEKLKEDNAHMKGERDTERGHHDTLQIEVKRLKRQISSAEDKENLARPNPRETATHKLNPRESRVTPVLVVARNQRTTTLGTSSRAEKRPAELKILAPETIPHAVI